MELEQSSLYRDVLAIITSGAKPVHYSWAAQAHANGQDFMAMKVIQIDIMRDYENNYSDVIKCIMSFPKGTFWNMIYPYSDNLEMTLFKYPLQETGTQANQNQPLETERYIAVLNNQNTPMVGSGAFSTTQQTLDLTDLETVTVELVDRSLNQMRMMASPGAVFRGATPGQVIQAVMTTESQKVVVDQQRINKGVNMIAPNNTAVRDHVVIPAGIPLPHIPQYVHEKCGGVYTAGMGYYLQNNYWFMYPCYDPTRANQSPPALTIIDIPKNKFRGIERTYSQNGSNLTILATGDVRFNDYSNHAQLNKGNGLRFADAAKMMEGFATVKNGIAIAARGVINTEAITVARPNGLNNAQTSRRPINANPFLEYGDMARRNGSQISMVWENSNPSLITPGMLVKIMYLDQDGVSQVFGVLNQAHHHVRMQGSGMTDTRHITDTAMSVFVQRPVGNGVNTGQGVLNTAPST